MFSDVSKVKLPVKFTARTCYNNYDQSWLYCSFLNCFIFVCLFVTEILLPAGTILILRSASSFQTVSGQRRWREAAQIIMNPWAKTSWWSLLSRQQSSLWVPSSLRNARSPSNVRTSPRWKAAWPSKCQRNHCWSSPQWQVTFFTALKHHDIQCQYHCTTVCRWILISEEFLFFIYFFAESGGDSCCSLS